MPSGPDCVRETIRNQTEGARIEMGELARRVGEALSTVAAHLGLLFSQVSEDRLVDVRERHVGSVADGLLSSKYLQL